MQRILCLLLLLLCASVAFGAISRTGSCVNASTSCTLSAAATDDLVIVFAYRSNSATPPSLPAGWTSISTGAQGTTSWRAGCSKATGSGDTGTDTWTNAQNVVAISYAGTAVGTTANCNTTGVGGFNSTGDASATVAYPAVTMGNGDGTSWVAGFAAKFGTSPAGVCTPSGMSSFQASSRVQGNDTNGGVASWSNTTCSITSATWSAFTVEILRAAGDPLPATPTFDPSGAVNSGTTVNFATATSACNSASYLKYTTDGSSPSASNGTLGTSYVVNGYSTLTLKVGVVGCPGYSDSGIATATYQFAATPSVFPAAGAYFAQRYVEPACTTASCSVYYTTDGSTPTTSSTLYTGVSTPVLNTPTQSAGGSCPGAIRYWKVTATNGSGESAVSNEQSLAIGSTNKVTLSWAAAYGATGYKVYRGTASGNEQLVASTASTSYDDDCTITPSGGMPTYNATAVATGTSGTATLKFISAASGHGTSAVQTATYNIAPSNTELWAEDFYTNYWDSEMGTDGFPHYPLDQYWTNGRWSHVTIQGDIRPSASNGSYAQYAAAVTTAACAPHSSGRCISTENVANPMVSAYTGATISNDLYISGYVRSDTSNSLAAVGRCTPGSAINGYFFRANPHAGTADLLYYTNGTATTVKAVTGLTVAQDAQIEARFLADRIQVRIDGSVPAGFDAEYQHSNFATGVPCILVRSKGAVSNVSMGGIGNSTYSANSYTPTYQTYTDFTNKMPPNWPWRSSKLPWQESSWAGWFDLVSGSIGKANGVASSSAQMEFLAPFTVDQFIKARWKVDTNESGLINAYVGTNHKLFVPGYADGGCAAETPPNTLCSDLQGYYFGVEPVNNPPVGTTADFCDGIASKEICGTPFFYAAEYSQESTPGNVEYDFPTSSWSPRNGSKVYAQFYGGRIRAYCNDEDLSNATWEPNHAYSAGAYFVDSNGNYQVVTTAGTSGATEPGVWGDSWVYDEYHGEYTTSSTMISQYYGQPCSVNPSNNNWTMIIDFAETSLSESEKTQPFLFMGVFDGNTPFVDLLAIGSGRDASIDNPPTSEQPKPWMMVQRRPMQWAEAR